MFRLYILICWVCATNGIFFAKKANINEAPYLVSIGLVTRNYIRHFCGGSIVSSKHVLTAAHCANRPAANYSIRAGSDNWKNGGSSHKAIKIIMHENFIMDELGITNNDIAIMSIDPPFVFDKTRRIIKLFEKGMQPKNGEVATISGWGRTSMNSSQPDLLQSTDNIKLADLSTCVQKYYQAGGMGQMIGQICGTDGNPHVVVDMCNGDSGGPLLIKGRQVGIGTWSSFCEPLTNLSGFYAEVAYYRDWIDQHVKS